MPREDDSSNKQLLQPWSHPKTSIIRIAINSVLCTFPPKCSQQITVAVKCRQQRELWKGQREIKKSKMQHPSACRSVMCSLSAVNAWTSTSHEWNVLADMQSLIHGGAELNPGVLCELHNRNKCIPSCTEGMERGIIWHTDYITLNAWEIKGLILYCQ